MSARRGASRLVVALAWACGPAQKRIPIQESPSIVVVVEPSAARTYVVREQPEYVSLEPESYLVVMPISSFITPEGRLPDVDSVRARLSSDVAPPDSCRECLLLRDDGPRLVQPGDSCAPTVEMAKILDVSDERVLTAGEAEAVANRVVLDWPGPCACQEGKGLVVEGPVILQDGADWPVATIAGRDSNVYLAGRHLVKALRLSESGAEETASRDGFEESVRFLIAPKGSDEILLGTQLSPNSTRVRRLSATDLSERERSAGPPMEILSAVVKDDLSVFAGQGGSSRGLFKVGSLQVCRSDRGSLECELVAEVTDPNSRAWRMALDDHGSLALFVDRVFSLVPIIPSPETIELPARIESGDQGGQSGQVLLDSGTSIPIWTYSGYRYAEFALPTRDGFLTCASGTNDQPGEVELLSLGVDLPTSSIARAAARPELTVRGRCPGLTCWGVFEGPSGPFLYAETPAGRRMLRLDDRGDLLDGCEGSPAPLSPAVALKAADRSVVLAEDGSVHSWTDSELVPIHRRLMRPIVFAGEARDGFVVVRDDGQVEEVPFDGSKGATGQLGGVGALQASARRADGALILLRSRDLTVGGFGYAIELAVPRGELEFDLSFVGEGPLRSDGGEWRVTWVNQSVAIAILPGLEVLRIETSDPVAVTTVSTEWDSVLTPEPELPPNDPLAFLTTAGGLAWASTERKASPIEIDPFADPPRARRLLLAPESADPGLEGALREPWIYSFRASCPGRIIMSWSNSRGAYLGFAGTRSLAVRPKPADALPFGGGQIQATSGPFESLNVAYFDDSGSAIGSDGKLVAFLDRPVSRLVAARDALLITTKFDAYLLRPVP
ncbi:MAG: hypothetical protein HY791_30625 [Deltaproteobacteria bacterium]|nr:hypothetical protein [Deltaproteobacteria bacterium]